ncbi:unnamed protein product, partial [Durusdinium trenchii]
SLALVDLYFRTGPTMASMRTSVWLNVLSLQILNAWAFPVLSAEQYPGYEVPWPMGIGTAVLEVLREAGNFVRELPKQVEKSVGTEAAPSTEEPLRPRVPHRFSSKMTVISSETGVPSTGAGFFAQDADRKTMRLESLRPFPGTGELLTNMTSLMRANESWDITGGNHPMCRQLPMFGAQRFADLFSWAASPILSQYAGERTVDGRNCSLWRLHAKNASMSLCASGDIPVELNMSVFIKGSTGSAKNFNSTYRFFGALTVGSEVPDFLFQKPSICGSFVPPCENGRGLDPVELDAYVFHPGLSVADYNIEDQNVADLAGDALFICMDCLQNQSSFIDHNYSLISRYILQVSPAFGQYALCNGYPDTKPPGPSCIGGDPRLVGKEAPFFAGDDESRCTATSPIGFWFGLPKGGHCPPGQVPGKDAWAGGCTWSVQKRLKTIHQACLLKDHGYLNYCKADFLEKKGFPRSMAALQAAFASEDPTQGGCKDVGGPDSEPESIVV